LNAGQSAARVQSAQYQVARLRSLHGQFGGHRIPNFTNHDDIGILPQQCANNAIEIQACFWMVGNLIDARKTDLDWVLDGAYISAAGI
jgi:hypothetical protein